MLPGKKYTPEDILYAAWRRKWFLLIPALLLGVGTAMWSNTLPNRYRATTTILIVPQRVPVNYVRPTVTQNVASRLQTISQQILSRTRLERIIEEFNLYRQERATMIMEDVVEQMRRDISVNISTPRRNRPGTSSFTVSYVSGQPKVAAQVAERLASLFVQQNLEERELQADSTNQFLQAELEDARKRLVEHEEKLENFRRRNMGQLPSQMASNLQRMQDAQTRLQNNEITASRERERLNEIEATIADLESLPPAEQAVINEELTLAANAPLSRQVESARAALAGLKLRLTEDHPDVRRAERALAELEQKLQNEALKAPVGPMLAGPAGQAPAVTRRLQELRRQAQDLRAVLQRRAEDHARLQASLAAFTARVDIAPALESELTELMRDYGTVQSTYTSLLQKSEQAKLAVNLERRQIGEQFRIMEGARVPERPFSPNRTRYNLMGLGAGLALGLAFAALLEYRDTTLKTDIDVVTTLALPVLAVIPAMTTTREQVQMRRLRLVMGLCASLVVLAASALAVWRFGLIDAWLR